MEASERLKGAARGGRGGRGLAVVVALVALVSSVGVAWPSATSSARTAALTRYPYVSEVVANSATVDWATDRSQSSGTATFGAVSGGSCTPSTPVAAKAVAITVGSTAEYQWSAALAFPAPGTYCYRVQLAGADLLGTDPSPRVSTAAAPGAPFSFAVLGDFGAGTTGEAAVMSRIGASPADFVVTVGDNVYNSGTETEYGDLSQGNIFPSQYLPALGGKPVFASEGNHGFTTNLPYIQDFASPQAAAASGGRDLSESYCCISTLSGAHNYPSVWYAFDWGSTRLYVLDGAWADSQGAYQGDFLAHWNGPVPGCGPCGAELAWLKSDLAAHASTPVKFAFFHYPLHADSSSEGTDAYLGGPGGLEGLLADNNVQIAFNGHAHQYERNYPQIPGKPLVSYVSGSGGAPLGSVSGCSAFDAYAIGSGSSCRAPTPASDANVYGFLLVTVNGNQVTVTPTDSTGRTFDVQTYTYGPVGPSVTIDSAPGALTNATSATLAFHSTTTGSTFTCSLDGAAGSACTSPATYAGLAPGAHTFQVTATAAGTTSSPAVANWTVDTSPPTTPSSPAASAASSSEVDLSWTASTDVTGVVSYDITRNGAVIASTSGTGTTYADKTVAPSTAYQYSVVARDGAGNASPPSGVVAVTTPAPPAGPVLVQTAGSSTKAVSLQAPST
ncbi:MAG: metallophosphoesterase, partial [Mycobacterium sp.]